LKQYNLFSKEFSLHFPIFMVPVLGEGHFIDNRFMEERNLCENRTIKIDVLHANGLSALRALEPH
jgi:hypothetical protein